MYEGVRMIQDTLDRFSQGLPDIQQTEPKIISTCTCGEPVYEDEEALELPDGTIIHDDYKCMKLFLKPVKL